MSRWRGVGPRCAADSMVGQKYQRRCYNIPGVGSEVCYAHGARQARLIIRVGKRRDHLRLQCVHMQVDVSCSSSLESRNRELDRLRPTINAHECFRELAVRYGRR